MEDDKIIDLYWERSEAAITETEKKFGNYCKSIAYHILSNNEDADECVNDTYLALWNTIPPSKPDRLTAFIGRITRNIAFDKYDFNTAQKRNGKFDLILSELGDCITSPDNVESQYLAKQTAKEISNFLRSIDYGSRNVFIRRYWYAESIAEVAERFHMSESKVKSMLFRTRKKLKQYLLKEGLLYE